MAAKDIIGWCSVVLFAVVFYLLYRFITSPPKVLDKILRSDPEKTVEQLIKDALKQM